MNNAMIPWDVLIEILNKYQANHPGRASENVNKYVNDEIYEWFNEQELIKEEDPDKEKSKMVALVQDIRYSLNYHHVDIKENVDSIVRVLDYLVRTK